MTPLEAIRKVCVACVASAYDVADCGGNKCVGGQGGEKEVCYFFPFRLSKGRPSVKIIRKYCLEYGQVFGLFLVRSCHAMGGG